MTFDEYWEKLTPLDRENSCRYMAYKAWNAATAAERQRCREIVKEVASASSVIGIGVANQIAEKIGE